MVHREYFSLSLRGVVTDTISPSTSSLFSWYYSRWLFRGEYVTLHTDSGYWQFVMTKIVHWGLASNLDETNWLHMSSQPSLLVCLVGWSHFQGSISPSFAFSPAFDITVALMVLFGGAGTLAGPVLGALMLEPLQQYVTLENNIRGLNLVIFGGLLRSSSSCFLMGHPGWSQSLAHMA